MSFFRTYIDDEIQDELFRRISSINFNSKADSKLNILNPVGESIQHQFIKSCWARASIVLGNGNVVSLNSNLDENNKPINEPLNIKDGNPYRGRPGITSISSNFKEYFLKQATINFVVPDPKEFDTFKDEFLKFGRYIMIEFGWTIPDNLSLPAINADTVLKASRDIQERIKKGKGNYNALVGVITNYTFNQTNAGSYEGTIEVSSMGRNVIGQKSKSDGKVENLVGFINNRLAKNKEEGKNLDENRKNLYQKLEESFITFNQAIQALPEIVEAYTKDKGVGDTGTRDIPTFKKGLGAGKGGDAPSDTTAFVRDGTYFVGQEPLFQNFLNYQIRINPENGRLYRQSRSPGAELIDIKDGLIAGKDEKYIALCSWGWFEDYILNSFFSFTSPSIDFKTEFLSCTGNQDKDGNSNFKNNLCKNTSELYSLGFDSIILPGQTKTFNPTTKKDKITNNFLKNLIDDSNTSLHQFQDPNDKTRGQIRNMYFNVHYLMESFDNTKNIEQSINDFWKKVSADYGGYWRFAIVENDNVDGRMMVTDLNIGRVLDKEAPNQLSKHEYVGDDRNEYKIFEFPVYSQNSIVQEQTLTSFNSSEMATLAVYGSNVNLEETSADSGQGYTALAMRALSMLDNTFSGGSGSASDDVNKFKYDNILNNISSPVLGNFAAPDGKYEGTSADYERDDKRPGTSGKLIKRKRDDGLKFKNIKETIKPNKSILTDIMEIFKRDVGAENGDKELTSSEIQAEIRSDIEEYFNKSFLWFNPNDETVQIYYEASKNMIEEYKRTMLYRINKAPGVESQYSTVLPVVPLQVSLTIQGIGGIKIGDLFYLRYLPKKYRDFCHFMVVNVEHEISPTGWTTKLDSRMIVDIPKLIKAGFGSNQLEPIDTIIINETIDQTKLNLFLQEKNNNQDYIDALQEEKRIKNSPPPGSRGGIIGTGGIVVQQ
jgi:hypothetical protein